MHNVAPQAICCHCNILEDKGHILFNSVFPMPTTMAGTQQKLSYLQNRLFDE
jgi:hypothetical protein